MEKTSYLRDDKAFIKLYKLMFSSLFARKMKYVYIDRRKPTEAFFSSIEPESIMVNMPTVDCMLHKVTGDIDLFELLNTYIEFDRLDSDVYCIHLGHLADQNRMSKTRDEFIEATIVEVNRIYVIRVRKKFGIPVTEKPSVVSRMSDVTMRYLEDVVASPVEWIANSNKKTIVPLDTPSLIKSGVNFIDISDNEEAIGKYTFADGTSTCIKIPYKDGFTALSASEFIKKDKKSEPVFKLHLGQQGPVVRAYYTYEGLVNVTSVQPTYVFIARNRVEK